MGRMDAAAGRDKLIDFRFEESFGFTQMDELLYVHISLKERWQSGRMRWFAKRACDIAESRFSTDTLNLLIYKNQLSSYNPQKLRIF